MVHINFVATPMPTSKFMANSGRFEGRNSHRPSAAEVLPVRWILRLGVVAQCIPMLPMLPIDWVG